MAKIHIILATYNGEMYLRRQLDSILQSYEDFCLHVFDDGSADATAEILQEYQTMCPNRIKVCVNEQNLGCTRNFLNGLKTVYEEITAEDAMADSDATDGMTGKQHAASRHYFMFCDQDDIWYPEKLSITQKAMRKLEKKYGSDTPLLVFTDAVVTDADGEETAPSFIAHNKLNPYAVSTARILTENKCIGCTSMMNEELVQLLTQVPEQARYHDWWMALLATSFGRMSYLNRQTLSYCQHGNNVVGVQKFTSYVKQRLLTLKKQKEMLLATQQQAAEFLAIYGEVLNEEKAKVIKSFATLSEQSFMNRRINVLRYGFFKTGLTRNIGLLLII